MTSERERSKRDEAAIGRVEEWLRRTRRFAPAGFAERVANAAAAETKAGRAGRAGVPRGVRRKRALAIGASIAAAAAALLLSIRSGEGPPVPAPDGGPSTGGFVTHEFLFRAGEAAEVCLVGSFNRWTVCETPLRPAGDDLWKVTVELPAGRHEYMFVVDDRWETDPGAPFYADDGFGHRNAVVLLGT